MSSDRNLELMDEATGTITIPQNVTKIGEGAFRDVSGLRSIVIPGTVKVIGDNAFSGNPTLEKVVIEEGVEKIGSAAFQSCSALKSIKIADSVSIIGESCFRACSSLVEINIPSSTKELAYRVLESTKISEIILPEGVEKIQSSAFQTCTELTRVVIPSTVNMIVGTAFNSTPKLKNLEISPDNENYSFSDSVLMSRDGKNLYYILPNISEINIPETVENIKGGALEAHSQQAVLNISKNVKSIETVFSRLITRINVVDDNPYFKSADGNLYNKDMTIIYRYTQNQTSFVIPNTVKRIMRQAFTNRYNLAQLTLPENLEIIDDWVFSGTKINRLDIPAKVKKFTALCFIGIGSVTISEQNDNYRAEQNGTVILSKDGKVLVALLQNLAEYNIPSSIETIESYAFYNKSNLKEIKIHEGVKVIKTSAFNYTNQLQKIQIPSTIEIIGANAFFECYNLKEIIIDKKEGEVQGAPWGCPYGLRAVFWNK